MALPKKKQEALRLITEGNSIPATAEKLGMTRSAVWKWTKEPEFSAEMTVYRDKRAAVAQVSLSCAVHEAVEALRGLMGSDETADKDKIAAAKVLLDRSKLQLSGGKVKMKGGADAMAAWMTKE
jgi:hypothetical protein